MNAPVHARREDRSPRASYLAWIVALTVTAGLCLAQQMPGNPSPVRRRNTPARTVQLPPPSTGGSVTLEQALLGQNASSAMTAQPLAMVEIGQLVWAAAVGTALVQGGASADADGSLQLYVLASDGLYRYVPRGHSLEQVSKQELLGAAGASVTPQQTAAGCGILMTLSSRTRTGRSDTPARRAMLLETGQRIQNLRLQAMGLGLAVAIPQQFDALSTARAVGLPRNTEILFMLFVGYRPGQTTGSEGTPRWTLAGPAQARRKAALIVAEKGFQDEELAETDRILIAAGVETIVVSSHAGPVTGTSGKVAQASMPLGELRVDDVDVVVFVGGPGAAEYANSPAAHAAARQTIAKGKILAAISTSPTILANAGLATGVRLTASETERETLVKAGAIFTGNAVERDRLVITANGPAASSLFGQAIVEALRGR